MPGRPGLRLGLLTALLLLGTLGGPLLPAALAAPQPAAATAPPPDARAETRSELYELVVHARGPQLTLYLDRYADNAPVTDAQLTLEAGGAEVAVQPRADGSYAATLPGGTRRAALPLTVVVVDAGAGEADLLALTLPTAGSAAAAAGAAGASGAAAAAAAASAHMGSAQAAAPADPATPAGDVTLPAVLRGLLVAAVLIAMTALGWRAARRRRHTPIASAPSAPFAPSTPSATSATSIEATQPTQPAQPPRPA